MPRLLSTATLSLLALSTLIQAGDNSVTYTLPNLPTTSESGQTGTNACGTTSSQTSMCQNVYINSVDDFCLFAPPTPNTAIGNSEAYEISWCLKDGYGTRLIPPGTITGAHFLETPHYIQVTGTGQLTNINVMANDPNGGGELDPHGATGTGNPIGGLAFSGGIQVHEWTSFMDDTTFSFRVCKDAPDAWLWCQHIYDIQGAQWNAPGNYGTGFDECQGDSTSSPPGIYVDSNGASSTYQQSQGSAPPAHPAGATSNCQTFATLGSDTIPLPSTSAGATTTAASNSTAFTTSSATTPTSTTSSNSIATSVGSTITSSPTGTSTTLTASHVSASTSSSTQTATGAAGANGVAVGGVLGALGVWLAFI